MKVRSSCFWTLPWRECDMCHLGPAVLYEGDAAGVYVGFFFFELGVRFIREYKEEL